MTTNSLNNECLNDFTVSGVSGATRKVRVENDNNTGSSNAISEVYVGGTSAGDPYIRHVVGSSHSYACGIDNSDSDKWKLSYAASAAATPSSASNILNVDTSGRWRRLMTPLFEAYVGTSYNMGSIGPEAVHCDSEDYDQGSNYNTGTYTFTCPVTGTYFLSFTLHLDGINGTNDWGNVLIYSSSYADQIKVLNFRSNQIDDQNNEISLTIPMITYAAAGDSFTPYVFLEEIEGIVQDTTRFSGYLLG